MIIMTRLFKNCYWLIAGFLLSARICSAQAPSGSFEFDFDSTFDPLINMTGSFQSEQTIIGTGGTETPIVISVDITNLVNGALKGSGFSVLQVGDNDFLPAAYVASGRISGGGGNLTRVILSVHLTGHGTVAGVETDFNVTLRYNLIFNSESGALEGTCRGSTSFSRIGGGPVRSDVSVGIPSGGDGT